MTLKYHIGQTRKLKHLVRAYHDGCHPVLDLSWISDGILKMMIAKKTMRDNTHTRKHNSHTHTFIPVPPSSTITEGVLKSSRDDNQCLKSTLAPLIIVTKR